VFNLDVGPVAQVANVDVDPTASFTSYGNAVVRGTVDCSAPADLGAVVIVELTQRVGKRFIPATSFFDIEDCPGTDIPFEVELVSPFGKFLGGHAEAQVIFAACNEFECGNETFDLRMTLRK
jgi:hypothetical protein